MTKVLTLIMILLTISAKSQSPSPELLKVMLFNGLENKVKPGYGTKSDPIPSGAFKYIAEKNKMQVQMLKLTNSYRWPDGQSLDFSKRFSTRNEAGTGVLDCYTLVKPGTTDTLRLFVDPYREETAYYVPEGLTALTLPMLKKELAPYVKQIDELDTAPDPFALKETKMQLISYIYKHIGPATFIDPDMLSAVMTDKDADNDLKSHLAYMYMISKFYAYAKDIKAPKQFAFDKMKLGFQKFALTYPEVKTGELQTILK